MAHEKVIVVGAGSISNAWFPPIKDEAIEVVGVVDLNRAAAEAQIEKYQIAGAKISTDVDQALRDWRADFLIDLTVPAAHCEVTTRALQAGLHVIGEKPMATSMAEARQMVQASEKAGRIYMVSQSRRWDANSDAITRALSSGAIGELTTMNCDFFLGVHFGGFRDEMPSPLILDMSIHHFDLARMMGRCDPISCYAEEFNPRHSWYTGDASANCLFEMTGDVRFNYRASWCAQGCQTGWFGDWRFLGERGTLLFSNDSTIRAEVVTGSEGFVWATTPVPVAPSTLEHGGMRGGLREMLRYLRTGEKPQTECHDNIKSLAMVLAVIESSKTRSRVRISDL